MQRFVRATDADPWVKVMFVINEANCQCFVVCSDNLGFFFFSKVLIFKSLFASKSSYVHNIFSLAVPFVLICWVAAMFSRAGNQRLDFAPARPLC